MQEEQVPVANDAPAQACAATKGSPPRLIVVEQADEPILQGAIRVDIHSSELVRGAKPVIHPVHATGVGLPGRNH